MDPLVTHKRYHRLEHLTLKAFRALDRAKTVVLLPIGMMEEHGNHLPLGTDNFAVSAVIEAAASWLLENDTTLHVLHLPAVPFGTDPVDLRRPELFAQAGSLWISRETLKRLVTEIAEHMVRYGFRYIFPVGFHGGAEQSLVLAEVCEEMREQYPGLVMYEPTGYVMAGAELEVKPGLATLLGRMLTPEERVALRGSIHASMFETSMMLYMRPDLVDLSYKNLPSLEWNQIYKMDNWPGYVGAGPRHADADIGGAVLRWRGVRAGALIVRAMNGEDLSKLSRHPTWHDELQEADAIGITEAPIEGELSSPGEPEVDSKPVMYISSEELSKVTATKQSEEETDEEKTPPSSDMETKPYLPKESDSNDTTKPG